MKKLFTSLIFCTLSFFATAQDTWEYTVDAGHSWISFPIDDGNNSLASLSSSIVDELIVIHNTDLGAYLPAWGFNGVGDVTFGEGFYLNTSNNANLSIEGTFLDPSTINYTLNSGWNFIGNPRHVDGNIEDVLSELSGFYIVQDHRGNIYCPDYEVNTIGNYKAGEAYKIYLSQAQTIYLPDNSPTLPINTDMGCANPNSSNYSSLAIIDDHTCDNYTLPITYNVEPNIAASQSEVLFIDMDINALNNMGIYSGDVLMVSADVDGENTVLGWTEINENGGLALTAWANTIADSTTLNYFLFDADNQTQTQLIPTYSSGSGYYDIDDIYAVISNFSLGLSSECGDPEACNYNELGTDDSSCIYPEQYYDCDGNCLTDNNSDGICDEFQIGCTDITACNFDSEAIFDLGSCVYADTYYDCNGNCLTDLNANGICDEFEAEFCQGELITLTITEGMWFNEISYEITDATNSVIFAGNDQSPLTNDICLNPNEEYTFIAYDSYGDGWNGSLYELTNFECNPPLILANNGGLTPDNSQYTSQWYDIESSESFIVYDCNDTILGCNDVNACNYNPYANTDDGSCEFAEEYYNCDNNCISDIDLDGICDELDDTGCTNSEACNYNPYASIDDGNCELALEYMNCDGECFNDTDSDGICDENEIFGCTNPFATNYNPLATNNDGSCEFDANCTMPVLEEINTGLNMTVILSSGAISSIASLGDELIIIATSGQSGNTLGYQYINGPQDAIAIWGDDVTTTAIDGALANEEILFQLIADDIMYSITPNEQIYFLANDIGFVLEFDYNFLCNIATSGCTDEAACNYNAFASEDNGSCEYAEDYYDCDGNCLTDSDEDGVCDENEVPGCSDPFATNYDSNATEMDDCMYTSCLENLAFMEASSSNFTATVSIDQSTIPSYLLGGYIGAFILDAQNNYQCIGMGTLPTSTTFIISGDNPNTSMIEGAQENDTLLFFALSNSGHLFQLELNDNYIFESNSVSNIGQGDFLYSCYQQQPLGGCTDPNACNYSSAATIDNGSCTYLNIELVYDSNTTTIISNANNGTGTVYYYNWYFNNELIAENTESTYTPTQNGIYSLEMGIDVVNPNINDMCHGTAQIEITDLAISEYTSNLEIYPNPANNSIRITNSGPQELNISIYSVIGTLVKKEMLVGTENTIDVRNFANGMYFFKISDGLNSTTHKVKIQH